MQRPFRRRRLAPAALVAVLALAGAASAQVVQLPPNGQVNDDPAVGIDPNQDAGVSDVVGGALDATKPAVPWGTFEQKVGRRSTIFVRAFKNGAWQTQGQSLNIQANQEAEAPSIDFAGTGRPCRGRRGTSPTATSPAARRKIFASRFNAANNTWIPEGQDRAPQNSVPSLNIHTNQDAENPALVGGAAKAGADPVPWVAWQETDGAAAKNQIFVSRAVKQSDCAGFTPSANHSVSNFCWQQVGLKRVDATSLDFSANGDPSLNIDPKRDGIEPDFAFTGTRTPCRGSCGTRRATARDAASQRAGLRGQGRRRHHRRRRRLPLAGRGQRHRRADQRARRHGAAAPPRRTPRTSAR